jgi:hypothetical protein
VVGFKGKAIALSLEILGFGKILAHKADLKTYHLTPKTSHLDRATFLYRENSV